MRDGLLFQVAKNPTRLEAFKAKHDIQTHYAQGGEPPWAALHMPTARKFGYGVTNESDFFDCVAKVCRLLDESGVMGYGETEQDAIVETCKASGITVLPNEL